MSDIFLKILNMSITAIYLVIAVVLLRIILKKAPKWINCVLWGIVGLRLILPFSLESVLSLIPSSEPIPQNIVTQQMPVINTGVPIINNAVNPIIKENLSPQLGDSVNPLQIIVEIASIVWLVGVGIMLLYSLISYLRLYKKVNVSLNTEENIYYCDNISSPFILGIIKPKIFIPSGIDNNQAQFIIKHEKAHLKRFDHFWKPFSFLLLSVYWFNPFMWLAYILLCRDIELACDEKVIKNMDIQSKKDYSLTLAECGIKRRMIMACPLAFGEIGVKDRIKSVLNYKKPAFWIIIISVIISIVVAICFLTNPTDDDNQSDDSNDISQEENSSLDNIGLSIDEIDAEYEKRKSQIKDNASLTNLNEEFAGIWKERAEDYYNILIEHYSSKNDVNTVQKYVEDQNNWKKQYELKMVYYKNVYITQYEMGSTVAILLSDTDRVLNRDRAVELYQRCVMIQFDDIVDISSLAEKYPEYFHLPVENGLNLYVEVNDVGCYNYRCKLTSGDNNDISLLPEATFGEMKTILNQNYNQQNVTIRVYFSFKSLSGIGQFFGIYNLFNETSFKSNFGITACNIEYKTSLEETFYKLTYPLIENIEIENIIGGTKDENVATDQQLEFIYEDDHHAYFFPSLKGKNVVIYFRGGIAAVAADAIQNGDIPIMALDLWDIEYITKDKQDGVEYFMGRIEAVNYDSIFVKAFGGEWESFYDVIEIPKNTSNTDKNTEFKVGMVVEVEYKGFMFEEYPASPSNTLAIYILNN